MKKKLLILAVLPLALAGCPEFFETLESQTCTITATAGPNGTIQPSGNVIVANGGDQTFTFAPAAGYAVDTVTVDGAALASAGATYAFQDVAADHAISVTFRQAGAGWSRTYGHGEMYAEYHAYGMCAAGDGGYVIAAQNTYNGAGQYDFWVMKIDSEGAVVWERGFGGERDDEPDVIRQTGDGGFIVAGSSSSFRTGASGSDAWVIKLTASGGVEWQRSYGGTGYDAFHDVQETFGIMGASTGYILCGYTTSFGSGGRDAWIVAVDTSGAVTEQKALGGAGDEYGRSIQITSDGGCILAADTSSFGAGERDVWLVKMDGGLAVQWEKAYGGPGIDFPRTVVCEAGGGYTVASYTDSFSGGENEFWLLTVDGEGDVVRQYTYGTDQGDIARSLSATADGGYIMTGVTYEIDAPSDGSNAWLVKLDGSGLIQWQKRYTVGYASGGGPCDGAEWGYAAVQDADGGYIVAGDSSDPVGDRNADVWIFKVDAGGVLGGGIGTDTAAVRDGAGAVTVTGTAGDSAMSDTAATVASTIASGYEADPQVITQWESP